MTWGRTAPKTRVVRDEAPREALGPGALEAFLVPFAPQSILGHTGREARPADLRRKTAACKSQGPSHTAFPKRFLRGNGTEMAQAVTKQPDLVLNLRAEMPAVRDGPSAVCWVKSRHKGQGRKEEGERRKVQCGVCVSVCVCAHMHFLYAHICACMYMHSSFRHMCICTHMCMRAHVHMVVCTCHTPPTLCSSPRVRQSGASSPTGHSHLQCCRDGISIQ